MTEELTLIDRARIFATQKHAGIVRPNRAQEPYIDHCAATAELVRDPGGSEEEIAGAWLHDTVEDTPTTLVEVKEYFGAKVEAIVNGVTDPPEFANLLLIVRKTRQAERIKFESNSVKRVKIADQTSNLRSVAIDPPVKWDRQTCLDYINGANLIARECRGVSHYLDYQFQQAYRAALRVYGAEG